MPIKKCTFERPPAAPIFKPTIKEFEDPLTYIEKIRPIAQKYGICKIISPKQWNPPFAVDRNSFKFRPRVQRLNEVGAQSRIRNNFYRSLEAYWEHQSNPLVLPVVRGVRIDLFQLQVKVSQFGGSHQVTKNKQWTMICRELGMGEKAKVVSSHVKASYDRLIQPYIDFCDNKFMEENSALFPEDVAPTRMRGKTAMTLSSPKMTRSKTQRFKKQTSASCNTCESLEEAESMVTCVECGLKFHINCLDPPLSDVISPWVCSRCLQVNCARELSRLDAEVFGFSQSTCKYSLESFANYAENFKKTYFHDRQNVSMKDVEEEYWRLVAAEDEGDDVTVKYGADISSGLTSSGFPTKTNRHLYSESDQKYVENGWNLNNLPVLDKSIFRFVSNDISGMTVPWCYVGMVFSCFCWHIEDHWSYSINYMHTGECKTWYGVPESDAELFEDLMRKEAGQLFSKSPDLLHHITTQLNPTVLLKNNVKVYRTDQAPGEFVVTFPRAYHSGFNQGFNFAEAVNFCPADWLSKGRASVESYRLVKRPSVFSHNELICKMAASIDTLDLVLLKAVYDEIVVIQQDEKLSRKNICTMCSGTCRTERLHLDKISEDDRECLHCRTTLYISGVTCTACCKDDRMMCLDHVLQTCTCANKENLVLKYRYSLDEISAMVANVKNKLEQYNLWMTRLYHLAKSEFCSSPVSAEEGRVMKNVSQFIENLGVLQEDDISVKCVEEKPNLEELKMLLQLGKKMNCPELLLDFLEAIIDTCQRAMSMTEQLLRSHHRPNPSPNTNEEEDKENEVTDKVTNTRNDKLSLGEMRLLVEKLRSLPAHVPQLEEAAQTLYSINEWRRRVRSAVSTSEVVEHRVLNELIDSGESNLVYLSEYGMLRRMRVHALWIQEARRLIDCSDKSSLPTLAQLKKTLEDGVGLVNTVEIDRIATMMEGLESEEDEDAANQDEMSDYRGNGWGVVVEHLTRYQKRMAADIVQGETMQREADGILRATPGIITLSALKTLLRNAESKLNCVVVGIERLKEVLKEAVVIHDNIADMWQKVQQYRRLIHIDDLQTLIKQADALCVTFTNLSDLKSLNNAIEAWRKNLSNLFLKPSAHQNSQYLTPLSLLELLFPRPVRVFKLMIARESVSSKLVAACKAESVVKEEPIDSCDDNDKQHSAEEHNKAPKSRISRKSRGRQKRSSFSSDDPQVARHDNVSQFESFLKSSQSSEIDAFQNSYKSMCVEEVEWIWNLRELNEEKASKDSSGHDVYCFCRKRGIDQKGAQVMCDLCQDWCHLSCLGITHNKDMRARKFLCPQCERSRRPAFEVILAEKRRLEQEARMVRVPEHIVLCLMSQRVIGFHKHTNQLFSPQTELGAVFAEYKRLFGVHAILPRPQDNIDHHGSMDNQHLSSCGAGKQSRKTPHSNISSATVATAQSTVTTAATQLSVPPQSCSTSSLPSKEALINIQRLKVSLSEEARRELEEIYIELCLLEVSQPTVTWIWKLYQSLIAGDDSDGGGGGAAVVVKKEHRSGQASSEYSGCDQERENEDEGEYDDCGDGDDEQHKMDTILKMIAKNESVSKAGRSKRGELSSQMDKIMKRECLSHSEDRKDALQKFSFKRKLVGKNLASAPSPVKVKKQSLKSGGGATSSKGAVTRKRGRGSKTTPTAPYRDVWERTPALSSEYYDEENDVILLDNVDISADRQERHGKSRKRVKTTAMATSAVSVKSMSDTKSTYGDNSYLAVTAPTTSSTRLSGRQHRVTAGAAYMKQLSTEKSDEKSPSGQSYCDQGTRVSANQHRRGRKPILTPTASTSTNTVTIATTMKRRRRGTTSGRSSGGTALASKRVCNDDCEADLCVQQSSDNVNWVACDVCNLWYHWLCLGIKSDLEVGERFLCPRCKESGPARMTNRRRPGHRRVSSPIDEDEDQPDGGEEEEEEYDDEVCGGPEDLETDDLNVTLEEEEEGVHCPRDDDACYYPDNSHSHANLVLANNSSSRSMSPAPPFLQPECCVQEEVVEISYVSQRSSDSD